MKLKRGAVIVLEGLDKTGKSTQRETLAAMASEEPRPTVAHLPSGLLPATEAIYRITEANAFSSPLALQLLHLACQAENMQALTRARSAGAVILDRWWWSTVAYGWFGGLRNHVAKEQFFGAIRMCWDGFPADVVFLFLSTYRVDAHNASTVTEGYRWLAAEHPAVVVEVPRMSQESTTAFILDKLVDRGIATRAEGSILSAH